MTKPPTDSHITAASGAKHTIAPGSEQPLTTKLQRQHQKGTNRAVIYYVNLPSGNLT